MDAQLGGDLVELHTVSQLMLRELDKKGCPGCEQWWEMWNSEILPYIRKIRLIPGRGVRVSHVPNGTICETAPAVHPAAAHVSVKEEPVEYTGSFKITVTSATSGNTTTYTGTVAGTVTSNYVPVSFATVNGITTYTLQSYSETITKNDNRLFYLVYSPPTYNNNGAVISSGSMAVGSMQLTSGGGLTMPAQDGKSYTQLGRVIWKDNKPEIIQDWKGGVVDVRWYTQLW